MAASEPTDEKQSHLFKPGQSGNPSGRPKGSRNKLGEAFIADLQDHWTANGKKAIERVAQERPHEYLKVVASILPKELNVRVSELDELTDDQIARQLANLTAQLAAAGFVFGEGAETEAGAKPAGEVSALH